MSARCRSLVLALGCVLIAACSGSSNSERTPSPASRAALTTAAPADDPMPQHLTFAPGATISADGKTGIFFLDPFTGAAEGWVVPAEVPPHLPPGLDYSLPFSFTVGGVSADGRRVVYTCLESSASGLRPCGGKSEHTWYLLDTEAGARTALRRFVGDFLSISPDGTTLLGRTADGIALAEAAHPDELRPLALPAGDYLTYALTYARAVWSPDSTRAVLSSGSMINVDAGTVTALPGVLPAVSGAARWSPDGREVAVGRAVGENRSELVVFDRDGEEIWSKPIAAGGVYGVWSGDGRYLYAEDQEQPGAPGGYGPLDRVIVLDATTGATMYRIRGGTCPIGWAGNSHTLLTDSYGLGEAVANLDAGTLRVIHKDAMPVPIDNTLTILLDGIDIIAGAPAVADLLSYDLRTDAVAPIARVTSAWDLAHEPLSAGKRLVFTAPQGGQDCPEGSSPEDPPQPELLVGPFGDDAPVTRGGVH